MSALIASSAVAFTAMKIAGAVYLVGLGALRRSRRFASVQRYVMGTVYLGLGGATALVGSEASA